MKKISAIILIILMVLVMALLSTILVVGLTNKAWLSKHFVFNSKKVELYNEDHHVLPVSIKTDTYDVVFKYHDSDKINVEINGNEEDIVDVYEKEDTLYVEVKNKKRFNIILFDLISNRITISVPKDYELPIDASIRTGDFKFNDANKSKLNVKTSTGDIYVHDAYDAFLETSTGDVTVTDTLSNGSISCTTGDIRIDTVINGMKLKTTTGDIKIKNVAINTDSTIKCTTGDIRISKTNDIYIEGTATTGDVKIKGSNRHSDTALTIKTTTGDIRVN